MTAAESDGLFSTPRSPAQRRILAAALDLFGEHGVSATSLQMIADRIGVTKAAVYHKFKTKDEIVLAVTEMQLARLEPALEAAEADDDRLRARKELLDSVIDMAVDQRHMVSVLQNDPVVARLLAEHKSFQGYLRRLYTALMGDKTAPEALTQAAMLSGAINSAVSNPLVATLDDATLRAHLVHFTRLLVGLPTDAAPQGRSIGEPAGTTANSRRQRRRQ